MLQAGILYVHVRAVYMYMYIHVHVLLHSCRHAFIYYCLNNKKTRTVYMYKIQMMYKK